MYLRGRGRLGYLTGSVVAPNISDPSYAKWEAENSLIMAWLINSMEVDIGKMYLFLSSAKEIWETVQEAYSDLENSAQVFELKSKLRDQRQNSLTVTQYYNTLYNLWHEIDMFYIPEWKCSDDASYYQKMLDRERLFDFLHGLNRELDEVCGRLLGKNPLPSVREAFAEVRREESRKRVMLGSPIIVDTNQYALAANQFALAARRPNIHRERPWCTHCNKVGHTKETCWPSTEWKPRTPNQPRPGNRSGNRAFTVAASSTESYSFSEAQINQLRQRLNPSSTPSTAPEFSNPEKQGISAALNVQNSHWIVDSGNSDHMTGQSDKFITYIPFPGNQKIKVEDGSLSSVAGKGTIYLSPSIILKDVLHVPNLSCNLLSDMSSGKTIRNAKACSGLYYFDPSPHAQLFYPNYSLQGGNASDVSSWNTCLPKIIPNILENDTSLVEQLPPSQLSKAKDLSLLSTMKESSTLSHKEWRKAVYEEIGALEANKTWSIVKQPMNKHAVGCKWVFTVKHKADGIIDRYKLRLVAKGFTQKYGVDYNETFAPIVKLNTVRVLLSIAANLDWPLQQLDVKNAFFNKYLEEEIFMKIPPGFEKRYGTGNVCRLKKSIYGLKQSPLVWFKRFEQVMQRHKYKQAQSNHTLFFKHSSEVKISILIVYVDDMIITGDDHIEHRNLKDMLAQEFEVKDLGQMKYFLGMEVARTK
ncbi:uncharacterized protein LOC141691461 [Apium graveolens]|uniref:uncharacterized protein LOC141691461 n=1 Tax=Apium graveolens TaxID=4045 RepID=UPI003D7A6AA5